MLNAHRWMVLLATFAGGTFAAGSHFEVAPEIRDEAKFFSAAAVKKADERIREIYRKHNRDVLIETFATVPAADADKVKAMDTDKSSAYFTQWAKDRSKDRVVNGLYVMICKEPRHLLVGIVENMPRKFTPEIRNAVEAAFRGEFKEERYDEGLDHAIRAIEEKFGKK